MPVFSPDLQTAWGCLLSVIARRAGGPSPEEAISAAYYLVVQVRLGHCSDVCIASLPLAAGNFIPCISFGPVSCTVHALCFASHTSVAKTDCLIWGLQGRLDQARRVLQRCAGERSARGCLSMQRSYLEAWLALREPSGPTAEQTAAAWDACRQHLSPEAAASVPPTWRRRWEEMACTLAMLGQQGEVGLQPACGGDLSDVAGGPQLAPSLSVRAMDGWKLEVVAEMLTVRARHCHCFLPSQALHTLAHACSRRVFPAALAGPC